MIRLIIFDYDGVIVDSFTTVHTIYKAICNELGLECPTDIEEFRKAYGRHAGEARRNLGITEDLQPRAEAIYRRELPLQDPKLFEGTREVVERLSRRHTLAIISSNYESEVEEKLQKHGLRGFFSKVIGKSSGEGPLSTKEKSGAATALMREFGVEGEETLVVGDRDHDHEMAEGAGIRHVILVTYGWGRHEHLVPPEYVARRPAEILAIVERLHAAQAREARERL